jgi:hypothetical protein
MRRRDFIALFGAAAAIWPLAARAQQSTMPVVGSFRSTPAKPFSHIFTAFRRSLNETGFVEGQNVAIEQRWADNRLDQLPAPATNAKSMLLSQASSKLARARSSSWAVHSSLAKVKCWLSFRRAMAFQRSTISVIISRLAA